MTAVELRPTRTEARALVVLVQVFWAVAGVGFALLANSVLLLPVTLLGLACGFAFYLVFYRVAGRELGRPATPFWFPLAMRHRSGQSFLERMVEGYLILFKLMNPLWWHRSVAPATGWPVLVVDAVMVIGLVLAIAGGSLLGWPAPT